ncbi:hypothetical protein [Seonamhaeicola aphaedonensis]|uniref:Uncharacterized protein n=1 Tax=Seonamhaeicola aphaedonensis TaxID=1461338 RepID=A0A3D9HFD3_9FLAO|nr:hypothetical protein [Seonamhaeicola aphaedonensis]RED48189.1 hypothetical protein DFQ02_10427 [Seonamhaeicola aphaedonensis]
MKSWKTYFYVLGIIPIIFSVSLLTFYFHAGLILGRLPRYNQPDPKELEIYFFYEPIINFTGNIWVFSLAFWLLSSVVYIILKRKQIVWKPILISALGQFCAISLFLSGVIEWFAD